MRPLPAALALILASGALATPAAAQSDARLHGAWTAIPPEDPNGEPEVGSMHMEFDARGRMFADVHFREVHHDGEEDVFNVALMAYEMEGAVITANGSPARATFHDDGTMTITEMDGTGGVEFVRARGPIGGLDVLGDWEIVDGPGEAITFAVEENAAVLRVYAGNRLTVSGAWAVGESGLNVSAPGLSPLYTGITREGDRITLTAASGGAMVLSLIRAADPPAAPGDVRIEDVEPIQVPPPPPTREGEWRPLDDGDVIDEG